MNPTKTVLITGGSSGIGLELSKKFAAGGFRLLWVSRPLDELEKAKQEIVKEFPKAELHYLAKDLSVQNAAIEVWQWTQDNQWQVDVLINNAGFGTYGFTNDCSIEKELSMINLNAICVYHLTRLFLREMVERDAGTIINISSNSSFQAIVRMNTYASTKAFVKHFSLGLQMELNMMKSNVKVITVCPAAVWDTPFKVTAKAENVKTYRGLVFTTAKEVAKDVWKGYQSGKTFIISGWKMRLLQSVRLLIPIPLRNYLIRKETETS